MSRTFASRPSGLTRGRGNPSRPTQNQGISRGEGHRLGTTDGDCGIVPTRPGTLEQDRRPQNVGKSNSNSNRTSSGIVENPLPFSNPNENTSKLKTTTAASNTATATRNNKRGTFPSSGPTHSIQGKSPLKNMHQPGQQGIRGAKGSPGQAKDDGSQDREPQRGQNVGAFTMFTPNEKRRQQVQQMAQNETAAYEQFKRQNAGKVYHHVGTVGGGELSENQVRNRQAIAVRDQKLHRQKLQSDLREARRRNEDQQLQAKKSDARRKAEQNLMRQDKPVDANEVRRNREAFLRQLEERGPDREQQQQQAPPSTRDVPQQKAVSSKTAMTTAQDKQSRPSNNKPQNIPTDTGARPRQTANPRPADLDNTLPPSPQASMSQGDSSSSTSQQNSEVDILCSMFPDWDRNNLVEILLQLGTAEAVIDMLTS